MIQLHTITGGDVPHDLDHTHGPSQPAHSEPDSQRCATIGFSHLPCATVKSKLCMNGREERGEEQGEERKRRGKRRGRGEGRGERKGEERGEGREEGRGEVKKKVIH